MRFRDDAHGGVLVYMGIMLPVLLGVSGLALDASLWYAQKRSVQAIVDTAAYSVMLEIERIGDADLAKTAAKEDAVIYGLDESAGDSITFNIPPKFGAYKGIDGYYEVIIERPATIFLAGLLVDDFDTAARAVSGGADAGPPPCLLASDPSMKDAFKNIAKNGTLEADPIEVVGDYVNKGTMTTTPNTGVGSVQDPLAGLSAPSFSGCDYTDVSYSSGAHDLFPGVYCGGISLSGSADITMQPGTYIIAGAANDTFSVTGQASVEGDGITAYFDGSTSLSINGQGIIDLSASTSESNNYAGILFFGDATAPEDTEHMVTGNGTSISAVMARELRFGGNGTLNFHISEDATLPPVLQSKRTLVE
jgi:hypothetical protein